VHNASNYATKLQGIVWLSATVGKLEFIGAKKLSPETMTGFIPRTETI
jgi:hypothetical protein